MSSELTKRILFGLPAAVVAVAIVLAGGAALAALLAVASALAAWEFYRIARASGQAPLGDLGCAVAGVLPLAVHARYLGFVTPRFAYFAAVLLAILGVSIWARGVAGKPLGAAATTVLGVVYTGGMLSFAYAIRYHDYAAGGAQVGPIPISSGGVLLGLPLVLTWATDIGAMAFGKMIGGRKLIPAVSPGKTLSGAVGGVVLAVIVAILYVHLALRPVAQLGMTLGAIVVFAIVTSVVGQIGDIFESLLKREAGVKDSSTLLPGHGGVLDRIDSLLFVLPLAHLMLGWLLIPAPR
ncbi:MAG TPA: phosphatidate cytidylyltransferase [Gemmatimonadaceae bacterium]|nr:phosphatidate cytidylyltransferase [Gemmatimonadaceae bacterium]